MKHDDHSDHILTYQRRRSSDHSSLIIVLGAMAGANELILSFIKWHHAPKVCAYSIDSICGKSFIVLHNKVGWISLKFWRSQLT